MTELAEVERDLSAIQRRAHIAAGNLEDAANAGGIPTAARFLLRVYAQDCLRIDFNAGLTLAALRRARAGFADGAEVAAVAAVAAKEGGAE